MFLVQVLKEASKMYLNGIKVQYKYGACYYWISRLNSALVISMLDQITNLLCMVFTDSQNCKK